MKTLLVVALLGALLMPSTLMAQSAFDGTWKVDLDKVHPPKKPDVLVLKNGMFECRTCVPPIDIKADGQDQKVVGNPYFDTMAVKVVDDHTIERTEKKDGKVVLTAQTTVAADSKTASFEFTDNTSSNGATVTGKGRMIRVAKGPYGSHAMSGSWRTASYGGVSDNGLSFTYKVDGDKVSMTTPTGQSYEASFSGADAPYMGDPGTSSISVKKLGKNVIQETAMRDGKVISVSKLMVAADGKTMDIAVTDTLHRTTMSFVADRQQ